MAVTSYLLHLHPFLFFILMITLGGIFGGISTFLFRKYISIKIMRSHNEVTGFLFLAIASFYALLLSFVMFLVWSQFNETRGNISREGSFALGLYRDIKFYPDSLESKQLMDTYLDFVSNIIHEEFPSMESQQPTNKTQESFNNVFYKIEHLNPKNQVQIQLVAEMYNHLNGLDVTRGLRISSKETQISPPLWLPMLIGAIIIVFCSLLMDIENIGMHITLNSLLGIFIGMLFFSIILLDHPFVGRSSIKPKEYMSIFTLDKSSKILHSKN